MGIGYGEYAKSSTSLKLHIFCDMPFKFGNEYCFQYI